MLSSSASYYSVLTKTKAKYGHRLWAKNYKDLVSVGSVAEITSYLKNRTHYAAVLSGVQESAVHRGNLEKLVFQKNLTDIQELCHFERSIGEHLFEYVVQKQEIDELLKFIQLLVAGHPEEYLLDVSYTFNQMTRLDLVKLSSIKNLRGLADFLAGTRYGKIMKRFAEQPVEQLDIPLLESALDRQLYHDTFEVLKKHFSGDAQRELQRIFSLQAELSDIRLIIRAKKYYGTRPDVLNAMLQGRTHYIPQRMMAPILEAKDENEAVQLLKKTHYARYIDKYGIDDVDAFAMRVLQNYSQRKIHLSIHAAVVMLCYVIYTEVERENITNIIEGVRYRLTPDEINRMLILSESEKG